ncbi:hypothetical protein TNIN_93661 [Trichonephila inaurata madagascariensis]|uniref:Uncharacterized protein n=1 Tax=Trichonephila inaurata madagascariensis TaxID=2747483 RepID=A0A8X6Y9R8_9ARAC|nr:hypothetical protein TNIN_93661 [Trichonephila inaurata madagascariensis]
MGIVPCRDRRARFVPTRPGRHPRAQALSPVGLAPKFARGRAMAVQHRPGSRRHALPAAGGGVALVTGEAFVSRPPVQARGSRRWRAHGRLRSAAGVQRRGGGVAAPAPGGPAQLGMVRGRHRRHAGPWPARGKPELACRGATGAPPCRRGPAPGQPAAA